MFMSVTDRVPLRCANAQWNHTLRAVKSILAQLQYFNYCAQHFYAYKGHVCYSLKYQNAYDGNIS